MSGGAASAACAAVLSALSAELGQGLGAPRLVEPAAAPGAPHVARGCELMSAEPVSCAGGGAGSGARRGHASRPSARVAADVLVVPLPLAPHLAGAGPVPAGRGQAGAETGSGAGCEEGEGAQPQQPQRGQQDTQGAAAEAGRTTQDEARASAGADAGTGADADADAESRVGLAEYLSELTWEGGAARQGDHTELDSEPARALRLRARQARRGPAARVAGALALAPRPVALCPRALREALRALQASPLGHAPPGPAGGGGVAHPNVFRPAAVLVGRHAAYALSANAASESDGDGARTLERALRFGRAALRREGVLQLVAFQLLSALAHCHAHGLAHGDVRAATVLLSPHMWLQLAHFGEAGRRSKEAPVGAEGAPERAKQPEPVPEGELRSRLALLYQPRAPCCKAAYMSAMGAWRRGAMSNYDYLLLLNELAGRRAGDISFLPTLPWVIDMTTPPEEGASDCAAAHGADAGMGGWRDLTKSKWRLSKGDEQLDFTYANSDPPHHISDEALSELTACIYTARRQPLETLQRVVRANYEPNEYPATLARLYAWSPDECIPEFYSDPTVFQTIHGNMPDLAVPPWARDADDFVRRHRAALESPRVSSALHHWIDITFGFKLAGASAVEAKNVALPQGAAVTAAGGGAHDRGRYQLFKAPHPPRVAPARKEPPVRYEQSGVAGVGEVAVRWPAHGSAGDHQASTATICNENEPIFVPLTPEGGASFVATLTDAEQVEAFRDACKFTWDLQAEGGGGGHGCHSPEIETPTAMADATDPADPAAEDLRRCGLLLEHMLRVCGYGAGCQAREVIAALTNPDACARPSAEEVLASTYFSPSVRRAYGLLLALRSRAVSALPRVASLLRAAPSGTATLVAPACVAAALGRGGIGAAEVVMELVRLLPRRDVTGLVLPAMLDLLTGHVNAAPDGLGDSLVEAGVVRALGEKLGADEYVKSVHPALLGTLERTSPEVARLAASALSPGCGVPMAAPMLLQLTVYPLLRAAERGDLSAAAVTVLSHACVSLGEELVARHVVPNAAVSAVAMHARMNGVHRPSTEVLRVVLEAAPMAATRALSVLPPALATEVIGGAPPAPGQPRSSRSADLWDWLPGPLIADAAGADGIAGAAVVGGASGGAQAGQQPLTPAAAAAAELAAAKQWGMGGIGEDSSRRDTDGGRGAWSLRAQALLSFRAHGTVLRSACVLEAEGMVLTAGGSTRNGPRVRLWDLATGGCVREYTTPTREAISSVAQLGGARGVVVACDGSVHVWRARTAERLHTFADASAVEAASMWARDAVGGAAGVAARFTSIECFPEGDSEGNLLAGTSDGAVIELDAGACRRLSRALCVPGGDGLAAAHWETSGEGLLGAGAGGVQGLASHVSAVTALTPLAVLGCGRGATAAGLASGACAVVERGAGRMRAWFKAHEGAVTRLLPYHEHYMVSAGADRTVALWDLRMAGSRGGNSSGAKAGSSRMLVRRLGGVSSPVADCALVGGAVACAAGSRIAVAPLDVASGADAIVSGAALTMDPIRLRGVKGKPESANVVSLNVMPHSRLFVASAEDGMLHVCV